MNSQNNNTIKGKMKKISFTAKKIESTEAFIVFGDIELRVPDNFSDLIYALSGANENFGIKLDASFNLLINELRYMGLVSKNDKNEYYGTYKLDKMKEEILQGIWDLGHTATGQGKELVTSDFLPFS